MTEPTGGGGSHLDDRVLAALEGVDRRLAFNGLRRLLGAHPESLSRSLHRLERTGQVVRADGGYRVPGAGRLSGPVPPTPARAIARIELPAGTPRAAVVDRLAGRWFGSLRWLGSVADGSEVRLVWAGRDGAPAVSLGVDRSAVRVYLPESATDAAGSAAYDLLRHAVDAVRPLARATGDPNGRSAEPRSLRVSVEN